jgi:NitT/TauT family transport system permease protein
MKSAAAIGAAVQRGAARPKPVSWRAVLASYPGTVACRLGLLAAFLAFWEFGTTGKVQFWTSKPSAIARTIYGWAVDGSLWLHLSATLSAMALGYVLGCTAGILSGLALGLFPKAGRIVNPYIVALYSLPKIALAPLFVIVLGIGIESKVALVAITVFFIVLNGTLDGIRDIDADMIQALRIMGATGRESTRIVTIPATLPWIFTGMRISVRYAFTGTLLAELIAANRGLGFLIEDASGRFDSTAAYSAVVILVIFSVGLTEILTRIERAAPAARR